MRSYYVKLTRMKLAVISVEPVDEEFRFFSSKKLVENWLANNGFIYGQRSFFNYPTGYEEWYHKDDLPMEYVDVDIIKIRFDDFTESKFKNLNEIHPEWMQKLLKELKETEA